MSVGLLFCI